MEFGQERRWRGKVGKDRPPRQGSPEALKRDLQDRAEDLEKRRSAAGRIGANERRERAIMSVPQGMKVNSQRGVSMMLIAATSVTPQQLEAGVAAMTSARDNHRGERAALLAALTAMGFEYRQEGV